MMTTQAIADIYPLVPLQQGILFHSLLAPQSGAYVVQVNFAIEGDFNSSAFEQAWQRAIARHTVLRTAFVWENLEKPLQVVGQQVKLPIEILDWQQFANDEQQQRLKDLLQTQRTQGFVLTQAPLMRLTLAQVQPQQWQVIWCYHHLLLDGWSVPLLLQEVLTYYHSFSNGQPVTLPAPRPYRDYIAWLQQQSLAEAEQFWRKTLSGFFAPTPLKSIQEPSQRSHPAHPAISQYLEHQLNLSPELAVQLQAFAQQHQLTLNTLFQAAYALLLSRYSDELDVVFGVTSSGRPPELSSSSSMIGLFINTLPLRVKIHSQQRLLSWLKNLQTTQVDLRQYEFTSLIDIQRWSEVPHSSPLFESLLIFENYPISPDMKRSLTQLNLHNIQTTEQTNYPLTLYVVADENVTLRILYDSDRFTSSSMSRMLGHLQILLTGIIENPDQRISELTLLTPVEQQQLLIDWNDTDDRSIPPLCFHQRFEQQAQQTPDAIALLFQDSHLSYSHLNDRANQLAHSLISLNLAPEAPIALHLHRSLDMVIALLAVLKAGACYLPLDPSLPAERLAFMLSDAQAPILITTPDLPVIPADSVRTIHLDDCSYAFITHPDRPTPCRHAAYLLYTFRLDRHPQSLCKF
ncbi:MAG: AMP-binding protein [Leptolyngbyaceae cyanobacterium CSU_1_4]|nr:AMP-binding protein [Leptolyngbyaceae cyanobacterium CSU_1_4]